MSASGTVAEDGVVTVSGTYRCSPERAGVVFVATKLRQGETEASISGSQAVCDGAEHTWTNTDTPAVTFAPGSARGEATLLELRPGRGLLPLLPSVVATDRQDVTLHRP